MNFFIFLLAFLFYLIPYNNNAINLEKLKLKKFTLKNMTGLPATLEITFEKHCLDCPDHYLTTQNITIPSKKQHEIKEPKSILHAASSLHKDAYLTFKPDSNQRSQIITITTTKELDPLAHLDFFDACNFDPHFTIKLKNPETFDPLIKLVLPETMNPSQWISFLNEIYEKNNLAKRRNLLSSAPENKMPLIMHKIWLGSELPLLYQQWLKGFKKIHPEWRKILWTEENINAQFPDGLFNQQTFDQVHEVKNYGGMSDIVRLELLNRFGGLYMDTDVICFESFRSLHTLYDFYVALEHFTYYCCCCNAILGAKPNHPIIQECMLKIKTSLPLKDTFSHDAFLFAPYVTGPGAITRAIIEKINQPGNIDIVFPCIFFNALQLNAVTNVSSNLNQTQQEDLHTKKHHSATLCSHEFHGTWLLHIHEALAEKDKKL